MFEMRTLFVLDGVFTKRTDSHLGRKLAWIDSGQGAKVLRGCRGFVGVVAGPVMPLISQITLDVINAMRYCWPHDYQFRVRRYPSAL